MRVGWTYRGALEKMLKNRASPSSGSAESAAYKLFNLKKTLNGVIFQGISISDGRVQRRLSQALLRDAQWQWAQSKTLQSKNLPSEYQETFFCCHGDWAVTNLALGAHGISFLRETQKLCDCGLWPSSFSGSAWAGELGPVDIWWSFFTSVILRWFCESKHTCAS